MDAWEEALKEKIPAILNVVREYLLLVDAMMEIQIEKMDATKNVKLRLDGLVLGLLHLALLFVEMGFKLARKLVMTETQLLGMVALRHALLKQDINALVAALLVKALAKKYVVTGKTLELINAMMEIQIIMTAVIRIV